MPHNQCQTTRLLAVSAVSTSQYKSTLFKHKWHVLKIWLEYSTDYLITNHIHVMIVICLSRNLTYDDLNYQKCHKTQPLCLLQHLWRTNGWPRLYLATASWPYMSRVGELVGRGSRQGQGDDCYQGQCQILEAWESVTWILLELIHTSSLLADWTRPSDSWLLITEDTRHACFYQSEGPRKATCRGHRMVWCNIWTSRCPSCGVPGHQQFLVKRPMTGFCWWLGCLRNIWWFQYCI